MVLLRVGRRYEPARAVPLEVGGEPALGLYRSGVLVGVDTYDIAADGRILALHRQLNPDKLARVKIPAS